MLRIIHKIYANAFGYFWLPCPVCKEHFGGHEISRTMTECVLCDDGRTYCVCPKTECNAEAIRRKQIAPNVELTGEQGRNK